MRTTPRVVVVDSASDRAMPRSAVDVVVGASVDAATVAVALMRRATSVARPVAHLVLDPPLVPAGGRPGRWLVALESHGAARRSVLTPQLTQRLRAIVPVVVQEVLRSVDLTRLLLEHLDVDAVVAEVDVDAVVRRCDVEAVLDRVDLTGVVLARMDLDALVAAVLEEVDLAVLTEDVIEAIDLPEIIRSSTGSIASETVHGARMQAIAADQAVARLRDRLRLRPRSPQPPSDNPRFAGPPQPRPAGAERP
jgi:hypothetical protein